MKHLRRALIGFILIIAVVFSLTAYRVFILINPRASTLSQTEAALFNETLKSWMRPVLSSLPYAVSPAQLDLACKSSIVLDAANGCVLYEKNADAIIPPASMTKLVVMYILFEEIEKGLQLDQIVPLPPESWAINALPGSSLMFLEPDQSVTLGELMMGMAVPSANDAAVAVAYFIEGSVPQFCERMNKTVHSMGLVDTFFVDTSGYSELNTTTAREFAHFLRTYLVRFGGITEQTIPGALSQFHSVQTMTYRGTELQSTNNALKAIPGCDGIKTGYIPESGYNLSLTVTRNGTRFIAVTMGGPGINSREGSNFRLMDAETITRWVFDSFSTRAPDSIPLVALSVLGGKQNAVQLMPAYNNPLTVPAILEGRTAHEAAEEVTVTLEVPRYLISPVTRGDIAGKIVYRLNGITLQEIPLIADRTVNQGTIVKRSLDTLAKNIL